jgi:hypothetical protein
VITAGGLDDNWGTFEVIISDGGKLVLAENMGQLYSIDFLQTSYRSELYGMVAGLVTFNQVVAPLRQEPPLPLILNLHTDNMQVLNKIRSV